MIFKIVVVVMMVLMFSISTAAPPRKRRTLLPLPLAPLAEMRARYLALFGSSLRNSIANDDDGWDDSDDWPVLTRDFFHKNTSLPDVHYHGIELCGTRVETPDSQNVTTGCDSQNETSGCDAQNVIPGSDSQKIDDQPVTLGRNAPDKWFPWQVAIFTGTVDNCGGVLISDRWVLTAAHCIHLGTDQYVTMGKNNLKKSSINAQERGALVRIPHEKHNGRTNVYDIGLIKLETPVVFSDYVRPACLPNRMNFEDEAECYVTGWGLTQAGTYPAQLQMLKTKLMDQFDCALSLMRRSKARLATGMICSRAFNRTHPDAGVCGGDSGSPLSCRVNGKFYAAGVASIGAGCSRRTLPDIFTSVSFNYDWIKQKLYDN